MKGVDDTTDPVRRRIDEVFGGVLPVTTGDERDDREPPAGDTRDEHLIADRPPHHDRD